MTQEQIEGTRLIAEYTKEYTSFIAPNGKVMLIDGAGTRYTSEQLYSQFQNRNK